jgi:hypothetical protein
MSKQTVLYSRPRHQTIDRLSQESGIPKRTLLELLKDESDPLPHYRLTKKTILVDLDEFALWVTRRRADTCDKLNRIAEDVLRGL